MKEETEAGLDVRGDTCVDDVPVHIRREETWAPMLRMRLAPVGLMKAALVTGQVILWHLRGRRAEGGLRILCYHRISSARDQLAVPPARFVRQLDTIEKSGLPVIDLTTALAAEGATPADSLALTFDDGYADFLDNALPELQKRGWPATVFVVPGAIEGRVRFSWYRREQPRLISWSEMLDVERDGLVRFEPHTLSHAPLSALSNEDAWHEIAGSKRAVAAALGREPHLFCYPGGYYGEREMEMVERAGYVGAISGEHGVNEPPFHRFALRRIPVDRYDTARVVSARLQGATDRRPPGVRARGPRMA